MIAGALNRKKPRSHVYIAGPIGKPEAMEQNALAALVYANRLKDVGLVPFVPHLCVWWDRHYPGRYEDWFEYVVAWLKRCDALLRIPGESPGADKEMVIARQLNIPSFYNIPDLVLWARK
jgi:hypothetical protein